MPIVRRSEKSEWDVNDIAALIALDNLDAALRFLQAVEDSCKTLATFPNMGRGYHLRNPAFAGTRIWVLSGFENYMILYRPIDGGVYVIRVLHGMRDLETLLEDDVSSNQ